MKHADLLKAHFMASSRRSWARKNSPPAHCFPSATAPFIYVQHARCHPSRRRIVITHTAAGAETCGLPAHAGHAAEENSKVTVVDYVVSRRCRSAIRRFAIALGANDLYAGHGAQLTYVAAQKPGRAERLSFQFNSTVVRRDARVQSLNLASPSGRAARPGMSRFFAAAGVPGAFSEMLGAGPVAQGAQGVRPADAADCTRRRTPKSDLLYKERAARPGADDFLRPSQIIVDPGRPETRRLPEQPQPDALTDRDDAEANALPTASEIRKPTTFAAPTQRHQQPGSIPSRNFISRAARHHPRRHPGIAHVRFSSRKSSRSWKANRCNDALYALIKAKFQEVRF